MPPARTLIVLVLAAGSTFAATSPECDGSGGFMSELRCGVDELQPVDTIMSRITEMNATTEELRSRASRAEAANRAFNATARNLTARVDHLGSSKVAEIIAVYDTINATSAVLHQAIYNQLKPEVEALIPRLAELNASLHALLARTDAVEKTQSDEGLVGMRALVQGVQSTQGELTKRLDDLESSLNTRFAGLESRLHALEHAAVTLTVNTTSGTHHGTTNPVWYTLYSERSETQEQLLKSGLEAFAPGSSRRFSLSLPAQFGEITAIKLRLETPGSGSSSVVQTSDGWGLGSVELQWGRQLIHFAKPILYKGMLKKPLKSGAASGISFNFGRYGGDLELTDYSDVVVLPARTTLGGQLEQLQGIVRSLARTLTMAQTQAEQRARSLGNSGLTKVRSYGTGSKAYHQANHNNFGSANVHDHSNNIRTVGLGEFSAVLNGVEFTTRHNDYALKTPHPTSTNYHETVNIEFPDVPPAVLAAGTDHDRKCTLYKQGPLDWTTFGAFTEPDVVITGQEFSCTQTDWTGFCRPQWDKMGIYKYDPWAGCQFQICGSRPVYKHESKKLYLYYKNHDIETPGWSGGSCRTTGKCDEWPGRWMVGDDVGGDNFYIYTNVADGTLYTNPLQLPETKAWGVVDPSRPAPNNIVVSRKLHVVCDRSREVTAQATEMREWFRAWQTSNHSHRDYRPYFRPQLCYMEGAWIKDTEDITEPFFSDRHHIDAKTWQELHSKIRFILNNGRKSNLENLPFLPTTVHDVDPPTGLPKLANWEYRIMCHSIKGELPINRFRPVRDLATQLAGQKPLTLQELSQTRRARFELNPRNQTSWYEGPSTWEFLDQLMEQVPGKDNYQANLTDESFGFTTLHFNSQWRANATEGDLTVGLVREFKHQEKLNTGYYSRYYQTAQTDASGRQKRKRGFNDGTLFAAMTSQPKVSGLSVDDKHGPPDPSCSGLGCPRLSRIIKQKWTWAVPIEVVFLTPLTKWNPWNVEHKGEALTGPGKTVGAHGRTGQIEPHLAYNGSNDKIFFRTPVEFYSDRLGYSDDRDPADTEKGAVGVLDGDGIMRAMRGSGTWIQLPEITGLGRVRQRYPIFPIHHEGNTVWKEVKALEALTLNGDSSIAAHVREVALGMTLQLTWTNGHVHTLALHSTDIEALSEGRIVTRDSSTDNGHSHTVTLSRNAIDGSFNLISMSNPEPHQLVVLSSPN